jgi:hypothetical protein
LFLALFYCDGIFGCYRFAPPSPFITGGGVPILPVQRASFRWHASRSRSGAPASPLSALANARPEQRLYVVPVCGPASTVVPVPLFLDTGRNLVWFPCAPFTCMLYEGKPTPLGGHSAPLPTRPVRVSRLRTLRHLPTSAPRWGARSRTSRRSPAARQRTRARPSTMCMTTAASWRTSGGARRASRVRGRGDDEVGRGGAAHRASRGGEQGAQWRPVRRKKSWRRWRRAGGGGDKDGEAFGAAASRESTGGMRPAVGSSVG